MALLVTQINGNLAFDHTCVRVGFLGEPLFLSHVKAISYDDTMTPSDNHGTHPIKLATGLGPYKANGSLTVVKEAWESLLTSLQSGYGGIVFPVEVSFVPRGSFLTSTHTLVDCRIVGVKDSSSQGQGGLDVEITLDVRYILRNGICLAPLDADVVPISVAV